MNAQYCKTSEKKAMQVDEEAEGVRKMETQLSLTEVLQIPLSFQLCLLSPWCLWEGKEGGKERREGGQEGKKEKEGREGKKGGNEGREERKRTKEGRKEEALQD
jgi:hypothetical protein